MVKSRHPEKITLSVGDGANDVSMITTAHVGVGIAGLEGLQAARSSDYAIGQFKHLKTLMFLHGREAYRRNAYLVCYIFYKNCMMVMPQYCYGWLSGFSGQPLYEAWMYQMYNIAFTGVPILWFGVFDFQYAKKEFLTKTGLYRIGIKNLCFSNKVFYGWMLKGLIQGLIIMYISVYGFETLDLPNGQQGGVWFSGENTLLTVILIANVQLFTSTNSHTFVSFIFNFLSTCSFFVFMWLFIQMGNSTLVGIDFMIFTTPGVYLTTFLAVSICVYMDSVARRASFIFGSKVEEE